MKDFNDPELIKFMRAVTCGGSDLKEEVAKNNKREANGIGRKKQGEDLTVDGYISKYGGIKSIIDDSIHTSKTSYNEHLKANNKIIKDW